ncbi:type IV secretory system conjugative DNA transfer family protein [Ralstonia sp. ASV6]|uniref:type IV secretory system conjugative DNA transfer family protein n=1 Tax=Ralstonia sp. ASV6 TaxID=2795124 RepID=UPI0018EAEE23|nr:type IV secretory system conjugative DNA transfer family protein [Ralstonia sp. ASV6]
MPVTADAISLEALQQLSQPAIEQRAVAGAGGSDFGNFRLNALHDAAFGVGARGGLISESRLINDVLQSKARELDVIWDFAPLMIQGRVVPPVLNRVDDIYAQRGDRTIRIAKTDWAFQAQARLTSRPPSWREYLLQDPGTLAPPSAVLYPANSAEREIWQRAVAEGWQSGVKQADETYELNLNRLKRDYVGMKNYRVLAYNQMVTMPIVAQMDMPLNTTGDTMSVDETLLRMTTLPAFNTNMKDWQALGREDERLQMKLESAGEPGKKEH